MGMEIRRMASLSRRTRVLAVQALVATVVIVAPAVAKEPIGEYRENVMESIGGHTGALAKIIGGKVPFTEDAKAHVLGLEALSKMVQHIFPAGSGDDTDALPAIWEKPAQFEKARTNFEAAVAELVKQAGGTPKEMAPAFEQLAKTCKNCHDDFRKKS